MIHDAYTREYDAQKAIDDMMAVYEKIARTAASFGLQTELHDTGSDVMTKLYYQDGKLFRYFRKLKTALAWAEKWTKQH